jgi:two-component system cell cycle response regulator
VRILIADDEIMHRRLLQVLLQKWGHQVVVATDGRQAWNVLQSEDAPRMAILDWRMPGMDGLEICRQIRRLEKPYVFIVLLTGNDQRDDLLAGLEAGVDDYITKPLDPQLLRARMLVGERVLGLQNKLMAASEELRYQADHDALTGLCNRTAILRKLDLEVERAQRQGTSLQVILADVDHFKAINDSYGHLVGDVALCEVARRMSAGLRAYDTVGRYGGEEFLVVAPGPVTTSNPCVEAERIREVVCQNSFKVHSHTIQLTISLGVATSEHAGADDAKALLKAADDALYRAKERGRNRVEVAPILAKSSSAGRGQLCEITPAVRRHARVVDNIKQVAARNLASQG